MSDFSGLEQSFALAAMPPMALFDDLSYEPPPAKTELQPREVGFLRLRGAHEIARILHLRDEIRLPAAVQADAGFAAREKKDEIGLVGAFLRFGEAIGTIRLVPMTEGVAPCEKLLERHRIPWELRDESWEVGRLVLAERYRSGPESLKRCLFLTLVHLIENTNVENLFASCTPC
ncbi:hypothetical protein [Ramlibacter montanisoli]|uniref:Uncharacterized protein n=1 Tax=Ramlibacter montanisoli TaxID=2732512 RepID=A0A849KMR1_9BURK|nr:hypothetical protein [Ramlibacter montanisoli]NNU43059.1 hypothetical protein [Ramlibacter montanisoli]